MQSMNNTDDAWGPPHMPDAPPTSIDDQSLASTRDAMTRTPADAGIEKKLHFILNQWSGDRESIDPLPEVQQVLESVRALPRGDTRVGGMVTIVRTLGQPHNLATLLDIMRHSAGRTGTRGQVLSNDSQRATQHCIYGWTGQTLLLKSREEPTEGTVGPEDGVREMLGEAPPSVWGLSMHIWQPNPNAKGFVSAKPAEPDLILEPPHSHPFDFASMVAVGTMRQSIYMQSNPQSTSAGDTEPGGRYDGVILEHVDGVWPPHHHRTSCEVRTLEAKVPLNAGDNYFMPIGRIHDVEIDAKAAKRTPTITLFLASEAVVKPHVYMAPSMAKFHAANPLLKREGRALAPADWHAKLHMVASYLRGDAALNLDDIVKYDGEYAFFHA